MQYQNIGTGGIWEKNGKKGRFFSLELNFTYNGHPVTARGLAFKNRHKENTRQPDYGIVVTDAYPAKAKDTPAPAEPTKENEPDEIPI